MSDDAQYIQNKMDIKKNQLDQGGIWTHDPRHSKPELYIRAEL